MYSIEGKFISNVYNGISNGDKQIINLDRGGLSNGMYYLKINTPNQKATCKFIVL